MEEIIWKFFFHSHQHYLCARIQPSSLANVRKSKKKRNQNKMRTKIKFAMFFFIFTMVLCLLLAFLLRYSGMGTKKRSKKMESTI